MSNGSGGSGGNGGGGSIGSATGLPAPNAGTVGSWPTYDLKDKKKGRKQRVEATKNAAWKAGVRDSMKKRVKTALNMQKLARPQTSQIIAGGMVVGAGALSIYDLMKSRGLAKDQKAVQEEITNGKLVDSKSWVRKIDPKIKVLTSKKEIQTALAREDMPEFKRSMIVNMAGQAIESGRNAFAFPGVKDKYVIAPPRTSANVLAHEVGHIIDFRKQNITFKNMGPYKGGLLTPYLKSRYENQVMARERRAWELAPGRKKETALERAALGSYDKGFHRMRGSVSAVVAATFVPAMLTKVAYGRNNSVGPTHERDGPQTPGELGVEGKATEVQGSSSDHRTNKKTTRNPGNQGGRGVPEWLRGLKYLRAPGTWKGGDKSGPQDTDNQFEVPGAGGRP